MYKVSLYIPCYNAEHYLMECLNGVFKQTYSIDEILVIDDGSNDKTVEIASKYPVRIIKHKENKGLASARNTGVKNSKNDFVASLDADCIPKPDWLSKIMENFTNERIAGVGGKLIERNKDGIADKWRSVHMVQHWGDKKVFNPDILFGNNNVLRKQAIIDTGYYNEKFVTNFEDVDLTNRLKEKGYSIIYESDAVVEHLRSDNIISLLRTYHRWTLHGLSSPCNFKNIYWNFRANAARMKKFMLQDNKNCYNSLIIIDILVIFYLLFTDFKRFFREICSSKKS